MEKIFVTRPFLPPIEEYQKFLAAIWESKHLTNAGPLVQQLEQAIRSLVRIENSFFVSNGTIALQIAIKALDLKGEVITTPFSYVATTSSLAWESCKPVFVDIDPQTLNIDSDLIEQAITTKTSGILATHVYGNPCKVLEIEKIAKRHNLKVIYDAAHCFGVEYRGTSILSFGDVSTISFHATKLFHTVEGGAICTRSSELGHKIKSMRNFGHKDLVSFDGIGINGKNSEFHAAMGLAILPYFQQIVKIRQKICDLYDSLLFSGDNQLQKPKISEGTLRNYSYYPIIFQTEKNLTNCLTALNNEHIFPRRYFYPSLTSLNYVQSQEMPISDSVATRVLSLPLSHELRETDVIRICSIILRELRVSNT